MRVIQGFERGAVACFWSCDVFLFIWFSLHFPQLSSGCKMSYKNQSPSPYSYSCGDFICWKHKTRLKYVQLLVVDRYTRPILEWFLVNRKILLTTLQIGETEKLVIIHTQDQEYALGVISESRNSTSAGVPGLHYGYFSFNIQNFDSKTFKWSVVVRNGKKLFVFSLQQHSTFFS